MYIDMDPLPRHLAAAARPTRRPRALRPRRPDGEATGQR